MGKPETDSTAATRLLLPFVGSLPRSVTRVTAYRRHAPYSDPMKSALSKIAFHLATVALVIGAVVAAAFRG